MEACQQGQVDHRCRHQQMESRLWRPPIARLSEASLDEPGEGVLDGLAAAPIVPKS